MSSLPTNATVVAKKAVTRDVATRVYTVKGLIY